MRAAIRQFRIQQGWNLHEMGSHLGVSGSSISNWETGRTGITKKHRKALRELMRQGKRPAQSTPKAPPSPKPHAAPSIYRPAAETLGAIMAEAAYMLAKIRQSAGQ